MKTPVDRRLVLHVAALARLRVADEDLDRLTRQMNDILGYVEKLEELELAGVEPTSHALDLAGALQADAVQPGLPTAALLALAPDPAPPHVRVPKVVEGGGDA